MISQIRFSASPQAGPAGAPVTAGSSAAAGGGDVVDFGDGINNGTEALMMPFADLLSGLVAGQQFNGNARVEVTCGDQKLSYVSKQPDGPTIKFPCEINGQAFDYTGSIEEEARGGKMEATSPLGAITAHIGSEGTDMVSEGNAGGVAYKEKASLDFSNGQVNITGQAGGEDFKLTLDGNGNGNGSLGSKAITVSVEQGPNGSFLIHENWGGTQIEKVITSA